MNPSAAPSTERERQVREALCREADPQTRWLGFDRFMHWALYHPTAGYYAAGGAQPDGPFGPAGDFVTATGLGPWLAGAVARRFVSIAGQARDPSLLKIREYGAGNGALAADVLTLLSAQGCLPQAYEIVEPSPAMRALQKGRLSQLPAPLADRLSWYGGAQGEDTPMRGLILANEVADAFPVKVFGWDSADSTDSSAPEVWEWGLEVDPEGPLRWSRQPAREPLRSLVQARQARQQAMGLGWAAGHRGEWAPGLAPWARRLMRSLQWGALLLIDYGYEQYELDHPDRCGGTLAGHWRHRRIDDWEELLARPGAQDLTAHVNFSEVAEAITAPEVALCLQTQAAWLLDQGVLEDARHRLFGAAGAGSPPQSLPALTALSGLQTLLSDGAMGQSFLVLTATRGLAV